MLPKEVVELLQQLRREAKKNPTGINFRRPDSLSDEGYHSLTGLTREQFEDLYLTTKNFLGTEKGIGKIILGLNTHTANF